MHVEGKDSRLELLSADPLVLSTPVELLAEHRVTDKKYLFVRNVQGLAAGMTIEPLPLDGWEIELSGLIRPSGLVIRGEDLLATPQVELEMILQCSGNGRTQYSGVKGTPWDQGGVANVRFAGVPLKAILEKYEVEVDRQVKYITARGRDASANPERPDFDHSIPIADVLDRGILALSLNGEPLPGITADRCAWSRGPVRHDAGQMVARLRVRDRRISHLLHATEYRVPYAPLEVGEEFRFTLENSRPTWDIRLMSTILAPGPGAALKAGPVTVSGVAYNDGKARIDSVLVSVDRGQSWQAAAVEVPASPYAWYEWKTEVTLGPGKHEIWARATDALGRSQPLDGQIFWNPNGYEWSGVPRTEVLVQA